MIEYVCTDNGLRDMVILASVFGAICGSIYAALILKGDKK